MLVAGLVLTIGAYLVMDWYDYKERKEKES